MTLFERVFGGNDAVYGLTEAAIDNAIAQYGEAQAVSFPDTAYSLPCYYGVTGVKVENLGQLKEALGVVKTLMTRNNRLHDAFMSGIATALCAEFIEVLKYIGNPAPYEAPCYGHLPDAVVRSLGVPLVTGDIPGVPVILGTAPSADEAVALVKSYQAQGMLITLVGGALGQSEALVRDMQVFPQKMRADLDITHGLIMAEAVTLALAEFIGKAEAHHHIEALCRQALDRHCPLVDLLAADPQVSQYLSRERLTTLLDPATATGSAERFVRQVLARYQEQRDES